MYFFKRKILLEWDEKMVIMNENKRLPRSLS